MKNKTVLYYVEWPSTKGNHAGMAYLCRHLSDYNGEIKTIKVPERFELKSVINIKGFRRFNKYIDRFLLQYVNKCLNGIIQNLYFLFLLVYLKNGDNLVFTEYITAHKYRMHQEDMARKFIKAQSSFKMYGIIHLPLNYVLNNKMYLTEKEVVSHLKFLDKIIVFGSSLKESLISLGLSDHIVQIYHYVDTDYYVPAIKKSTETRLRLIIIGFIMRDYDKLKEIIKNCPEVDFDFCMGRFDFKSQFSEFPNVSLYGLLGEGQLKVLMQNADISLNIMEDTVGSNVITTSMACGLAMIVSDVGSIRDYCDDTNAFFCNSIEDYVNSINHLSGNRELLADMSMSSRKMAKTFSLENFSRDFIRFLQK